MKHRLSYQKSLFVSSIAIVLTCWNGSMVDSTGKGKRPDVNFYGELEDHTSKCSVEDILIGGKYEQITVYQPVQGIKPSIEQTKELVESKGRQIDPKENKTFLDLNEVASISLVHPDQPIEHELTINNRKYIEIEVTLITGSKQPYIIESSRELSCLKINKGPKDDQKPVQEERKLNMIHVKNLWIKGRKSGQDTTKSDSRDTSISEKTKIAEGTEQILDQIEKKVNNLPKEDPSNYEQLKESLLSMLRSLRDQLQKMLNMIKS